MMETPAEGDDRGTGHRGRLLSKSYRATRYRDIFEGVRSTPKPCCTSGSFHSWWSSLLLSSFSGFAARLIERVGVVGISGTFKGWLNQELLSHLADQEALGTPGRTIGGDPASSGIRCSYLKREESQEPFKGWLNQELLSHLADQEALRLLWEGDCFHSCLAGLRDQSTCTHFAKLWLRVSLIFCFIKYILYCAQHCLFFSDPLLRVTLLQGNPEQMNP